MKVHLACTERYPWVKEVGAGDMWREYTVEIPAHKIGRYRRALKKFEAAYAPILAAYQAVEEAQDAAEESEELLRATALTPCEGCGKEFNEAAHQAHRPWCAPLVWPKENPLLKEGTRMRMVPGGWITP